MIDLEECVSRTLGDFAQVLPLAGVPPQAITHRVLLRPHRALGQPSGTYAVYAFFREGNAIKIGKVGPNSGPRFQYQHYNPASAKSTLAKSLLGASAAFALSEADQTAIGAWMNENLDRVDMFVPATLGPHIYSLLEAFLHVRWKPYFEGRAQGEK